LDQHDESVRNAGECTRACPGFGRNKDGCNINSIGCVDESTRSDLHDRERCFRFDPSEPVPGFQGLNHFAGSERSNSSCETFGGSVCVAHCGTGNQCSNSTSDGEPSNSSSGSGSERSNPSRCLPHSGSGSERSNPRFGTGSERSNPHFGSGSERSNLSPGSASERSNSSPDGGAHSNPPAGIEIFNPTPGTGIEIFNLAPTGGERSNSASDTRSIGKSSCERCKEFVCNHFIISTPIAPSTFDPQRFQPRAQSTGTEYIKSWNASDASTSPRFQ
jgi:hypothetical protein